MTGQGAKPRQKRGRLNRVVASVLALGLGVSGAMAATHFAGQHVAKTRVADTLAQVSGQGVIAKHGDIEVKGFIVPNSTIIRDVEVFIPSLGARAMLPEVSAAPKLSAGGSLTFDLPNSFMLEFVGPDGAPSGKVWKVQGQNLEATINDQGEEVFEFKLDSSTTRIDEEVNGQPTGGYFDFKELDFRSVVVVNREAGTVTADASVKALEFLYAEPSFGDVEATPVFEATDVDGAARLDASAAELTFKAGSGRFLGEGTGESGFERLDLALSISPKGEFDLAPLADFANVDDFMQKLAGVLAISIANGATYDQEFKVGVLKIDAPQLPDPQIEAVTAEIIDLHFSGDISPRVIGIGLAASKFLIDVKGAQTAFYDVRDLDLDLVANAGAADFDLTSLIALPNPDLFGEQFADILRLAIIDGGDAKLTVAMSNYESIAQFNDPLIPFTSMGGNGAESRTELSIDADSIDLISISAASSLQLVGQISGSVEGTGAEMEMRFPIAEAPEEQTAVVRYVLKEVVIDDQLWSVMDPAGALDHTITGITIDLEMGVLLQAGLLTQPEAFAGPFPPIQPGAVTIKDVTLDMLGFKGVATGQFDIVPLPAGAVDVSLTGWEQLLDGLTKTPLGQDPTFTSSVFLARGFIEQFGVPGDAAGETKMDVIFDGPQITINGQPMGGPQ